MIPTRHFLPRWSAIGAACAAAALAACAPQYDLRGNLPDPEMLAKIEPGKSTKADVTHYLGSPTSTATFNPDIWYYISRKTETVAFYDPDVLAQKVYVVEFDSQGLVKDVQDHLDDVRDVSMIARATPAPGREMTFLEQLLGNFGRFKKSSDKKKDEDEGGGGS